MKRVMALVILTLLLVASCSSPAASPTLASTDTPAATPTLAPTPSPSPAPTPTTLPTPVPTPSPTPPPPPSLTSGLPSGKEYKPICVMIENQTQCRKQQGGLSQADIVYEVLENGNAMTRFVAIYNDFLPKSVGPIRSCRVYYVDIASEFKSALCFFGGPPGKVGKGSIDAKVNKAVKDNLLKIGANGLNPPWNKYYERDRTYRTPHNVFIDINKIAALLTDPIEPVSHFQFSADASYTGDAVNNIEIVYNRRIIDVRYVYDPQANNYKRSQESDAKVPMIDTNTQKQITVKNIIVQYVKETYLGNDVGVSLNNFVLTGAGDADIFVAGKHMKATWKRPTLNDITKYYDESGKEITLLPGNTWVQVVPTSKIVPVKFSK